MDDLSVFMDIGDGDSTMARDFHSPLSTAVLMYKMDGWECFSFMRRVKGDFIKGRDACFRSGGSCSFDGGVDSMVDDGRLISEAERGKSSGRGGGELNSGAVVEGSSLGGCEW